MNNDPTTHSDDEPISTAAPMDFDPNIQVEDK
jgi:hypothetical protein